MTISINITHSLPVATLVAVDCSRRRPSKLIIITAYPASLLSERDYLQDLAINQASRPRIYTCTFTLTGLKVNLPFKLPLGSIRRFTDWCTSETANIYYSSPLPNRRLATVCIPRMAFECRFIYITDLQHCCRSSGWLVGDTLGDVITRKVWILLFFNVESSFLGLFIQNSPYILYKIKLHNWKKLC